MYDNLSEKDKEIVVKRLKRKMMMEGEGYYDEMFPDYCKKYLSDEKKDWYVIRTRGKITASKIKIFIKNPEEFQIRYVLELPELEESEKRHFTVGTSFDCLMSFGSSVWSEKYYIDKGYVKDELATLIIAKMNIEDKENKKKELLKLTLEQLREMYYVPGDKIRLTPGEGKVVRGMYYEAMRQPAFDVGNPNYTSQHFVEAKYGDLIISGTLDRYNKKESMIRDRKTAGNIDNFERDMENTFDYATQMAFYYVLILVNDEIECDVYLDVMSKTAPFASIPYRMSKEKLKRKMQDEIKPALNALQEAFKNNERKSGSRYNAMKSPYYPIMESSITETCVDSN